MTDIELLTKQIEILTWAIGGIGAFVTIGTWVVIGFGFKILSSRIDKIDAHMDKFDEKLTDIDRRLCRIEGAMMNKDWCMLKHDHKEKVEY